VALRTVVVGGGIGGIAAAVALTRRVYSYVVLQQSSEGRPLAGFGGSASRRQPMLASGR
jgi:thioredoxin reductase